jgi:2,3-bisphosphoglycerate-independent phosphoglycerate mutase
MLRAVRTFGNERRVLFSSFVNNAPTKKTTCRSSPFMSKTFQRCHKSSKCDESPPPVVLCILDGWGWRESSENNAVILGNTPNFDAVYGYSRQLGRTSFLHASEKHVGLPDGQIGNSEVGHMNIGAGRVVYQDICRIDNAIEDGSIQNMEAMQEHIAKLKKSGGTSHIMGLVSTGGVHAMQFHISTIANTISRAGVPTVVHVFTDGRDVPPTQAASSIVEFEASLDDAVQIVTVTGRYYAMDRDNRWERVGMAYDAIRSGKGIAKSTKSASDAIQQGYGNDLSDEFILPTIIDNNNNYDGMKDGDGIMMCNFRADRAREILDALASPNPPSEMWEVDDLSKSREQQVSFADVSGMVNYSSAHDKYMSAIFPPKDIDLPLGEVISNAGLTQMRMAETEKYPHVTFFLNGGREEPFDGEDRIMVPSPKVATYDLQPEMSAPELSEKLCNTVLNRQHNVVIINFANPDMVGHSGKLDAAIKACEAVDSCVGDLIESLEKVNGTLLLTADHGNCETMWDELGDEPHTAHTLNLVPIVLRDFGNNVDKNVKMNNGCLADIAPTILDICNVKQPESMTGTSLLSK